MPLPFYFHGRDVFYVAMGEFSVSEEPDYQVFVVKKELISETEAVALHARLFTVRQGDTYWVVRR